MMNCNSVKKYDLRMVVLLRMGESSDGISSLFIKWCVSTTTKPKSYDSLCFLYIWKESSIKEILIITLDVLVLLNSKLTQAIILIITILKHIDYLQKLWWSAGCTEKLDRKWSSKLSRGLWASLLRRSQRRWDRCQSYWVRCVWAPCRWTEELPATVLCTRCIPVSGLHRRGEDYLWLDRLWPETSK